MLFSLSLWKDKDPSVSLSVSLSISTSHSSSIFFYKLLTTLAFSQTSKPPPTLALVFFSSFSLSVCSLLPVALSVKLILLTPAHPNSTGAAEAREGVWQREFCCRVGTGGLGGECGACGGPRLGASQLYSHVIITFYPMSRSEQSKTCKSNPARRTSKISSFCLVSANHKH